MKDLSKNMIAFASLESVDCNLLPEFKELKIKLNNEFKSLSDAELRCRIESDLKTFCAIIRAGKERLIELGLNYMAGVHEEKAKFYESEVAKTWPVMDAMNEKSKRLHYKYMANSLGRVEYVYSLEANNEANHTIPVSDTEENLYKTYIELKDELIDKTGESISKLRCKKKMELWEELHQNSYDYLCHIYDSFEKDLNNLKTTEIRSKTLQLFINELKIQNELQFIF